MTHWIKAELDEETGDVTVRTSCAAAYGPEGMERDVTVNRDLELSDAARKALAESLKQILDVNRESMEREARKARAAAEHVAESRNEFDTPAGEKADAKPASAKPRRRSGR